MSSPLRLDKGVLTPGVLALICRAPGCINQDLAYLPDSSEVLLASLVRAGVSRILVPVPGDAGRDLLTRWVSAAGPFYIRHSGQVDANRRLWSQVDGFLAPVISDIEWGHTIVDGIRWPRIKVPYDVVREPFDRPLPHYRGSLPEDRLQRNLYLMALGAKEHALVDLDVGGFLADISRALQEAECSEARSRLNALAGLLTEYTHQEVAAVQLKEGLEPGDLTSRLSELFDYALWSELQEARAALLGPRRVAYSLRRIRRIVSAILSDRRFRALLTATTQTLRLPGPAAVPDIVPLLESVETGASRVPVFAAYSAARLHGHVMTLRPKDKLWHPVIDQLAEELRCAAIEHGQIECRWLYHEVFPDDSRFNADASGV